MADLIDIIDELNRGIELVEGAYMAAESPSIVARKRNALVRILAEASEAFNNVKQSLEGMHR